MARPAAAQLVVFTCALSAGIHAGLIPEHLREEPRLGVAFAFAVVLLLTTGAGLTLRPSDRRAARGAALVMSGLIVAYAASRTTGIPLLAPHPEALDAVGMAAISIELVGLLLAVRLAQQIRPHTRLTPRRSHHAQQFPR